jgi:hypothetical protein
VVDLLAEKEKQKGKKAKQNQPTGGRTVNGFLWRVHICVQKVCILLKYSYLCTEFKSKQIWKHYQ